jgi:hypothetical protein
MFPMGSTSAMVHQLSADLFECLDCAWMLVTTRIAEKHLALFVFGSTPNPDCAAAIECARVVRPIQLDREPGALALGPKLNGLDYMNEEIELTEEFAAHIAKILSKEARSRSWRTKAAGSVF